MCSSQGMDLTLRLTNGAGQAEAPLLHLLHTLITALTPHTPNRTRPAMNDGNVANVRHFAD